MKKILVVGSGAREHALCMKLQSSRNVDFIRCFPGNAGMGEFLCDAIDRGSDMTNRIQSIKEIVINNSIDIVVVGSEEYLCAGIHDVLESICIVIGPKKDAARLEGSKLFMKNICQYANIPTANFIPCANVDDLRKCLDHIANTPGPFVIKEDALAAGKGVYIYQDVQSVDVSKIKFPCYLEDYLSGDEMSLFYYIHKGEITYITSASDYKKLLENDMGPNTGGMGAHSGPDIIDDKLVNDVTNIIIAPTIHAMKVKHNIEYSGVLYAGIILDKNRGMQLLEYNIRFGDPECQVLMHRIESDILDLFINNKCIINNQHALGVVLASKTYPYNNLYDGEIIRTDNVTSSIYYASVKNKEDNLCVNGGRVMTLVQCGSDITKVINDVYSDVRKVLNKDLIYRSDIKPR